MTELAGLAEPVMSLSRRQRAMLKEMGVLVWQPLAKADAKATSETTTTPPAALAAKPDAIDSGAARARIQRAAGTFDTQNEPFQAPRTVAESAHPSASPNAWRVGQLQTLYAESALGSGVRWLILLESPASALQEGFNPFEGDAGKLLDNMLRAAKLHTAGAAMLAPLVRGQGTGGGLGSELKSELTSELEGIFASAQAAVVLVMGRLAAQALLQSTEPLARLRGQIHTLHNAPTIITIDPAYLLRNPLDKAKAWDDLCLALSIASAS